MTASLKPLRTPVLVSNKKKRVYETLTGLLETALVAAVLLFLIANRGVLHAEEQERKLTLIIIGDAGEKGSELRANATLVTKMHREEHDGGVFDGMVFLGDNFYDTGLNVPLRDLNGKIRSVLDPFEVPMLDLGRGNVHAIAGNHDYYARYALDASALFGLISIEEGPVGLTDRGNEREKAIDLWTYYYNMPAEVCYPLVDGGKDSVQLVFFDSARLLRTQPKTWHRSLDSLKTILRVSGKRPGIIWRFLMVHHPLHTVGEHGGYSIWNDETNRVDYLTQCDKDSNAIGWFKNLIDPEDLCAERYRQYADSLRGAIRHSGAKIQALFSGHDHSLQLLDRPEETVDCPECPEVHIVSGAGSSVSLVRLPQPPRDFTAVDPEEEGRSIAGFVQLMLDRERARVVFFGGASGERIDMGGGRTEFWIDSAGKLVP